MSVIAPCRSNPKATVASPNPELRIVYVNYQDIRGITGQADGRIQGLDLRPGLLRRDCALAA